MSSTNRDVIGRGVRVVPFLSDVWPWADTYLATNDFLPSDYGDNCDNIQCFWAKNEVYYSNGEEESEFRVIIMVYVDTYAGFVTIYVDFLKFLKNSEISLGERFPGAKFCRTIEDVCFYGSSKCQH